MGVARLKGDDYRISDNSGTININSTIENLQKIEELLNIVADDIKKLSILPTSESFYIDHKSLTVTKSST